MARKAVRRSGRVAFEMQSLEERIMMTLPWGWQVTDIGLDQAFINYPAVNGHGVAVAVIDRGIDYDIPQLGGALGPGNTVEAGYDFVNNVADPMPSTSDSAGGHGTGVAGLLASSLYNYAEAPSGDWANFKGVAPDVSLIGLKIGSSANETETQSIKAALDWVIANYKQYNIVAINMTDFATLPDRGDPSVYEPELQTLYNDGIFMSSPTGNGGFDATPDLPAASPYVVGAGGVDQNNNYYSGDELGSLDVLAPADGITLPYIEIDTNQNDSTYGQWIEVNVSNAAGTSFSSPQISGTAALLKQMDPTLTPAQILNIIEESGTPILNTTTGQKFPLLNVNAAIALTYQLQGGPIQNNNSFGTAAPLTLNNGAISVSGLKLLVGHDDYYSFTVSDSDTYNVDLQYNGPSSFPSAALLDSGAHTIGTIGAGGLTQTLSPGTYYIHLTAGTSLYGAFGLTISNSSSQSTGQNGPGAPGTFNSIAYDSYGTLYMAFYNPVEDNLEFATSSNGVWSSTSVIDRSSGAGNGGISVAIDANGAPAVAYYDAGTLKYATSTGNGWNVQTVAGKKSGQYPSLVFNGRNQAAVTYYDAKHGWLKLAVLNGGVWSISTIDSTGNTGLYSKLSIAPSTGNYAIVYENSSNGAVMYAGASRRGWSIGTVDGATGGARDLSLAFNSSGIAGISYYAASASAMRYAQQSGRRWSVVPVAAPAISRRESRRLATGPSGIYTNLFYNGNTPDILYYSTPANSIFEASQSGGVFSSTQVATGGGAYLTLAQGPGSQISYAYEDSLNQEIEVGGV